MRPSTLRATLLAAAAAVAISCSGDGPTAPSRALSRPAPRADLVGAGPEIRISEIHYDNAGSDVGESIEISGSAGTDLDGWSVVLYNGSNPAAAVTYGTPRNLTEVIPTTCNERGVLVLTFPADGLQNGGNDGIALIDGMGNVVELLSYEGVFTAANGPAAGMASTDIGVAETGTTPVGSSLQRQPDGTWAAPAPSTFGACNDGDENPGPAPEVVRVDVTPATASVQVGATVALSAAALDATDAPVPGAAITWSSLAEAVATVSASGVVTGVAEGTAQVVATAANGRADTAVVTVTPLPPPPAGVRFSEIHYDNFGTDLNEAIEVEGPAGTDLTGWSVLLYNGNGGAVYDTKPLGGVLADACGGRGVVAVSYPSNGIQNGAPDGFALVNAEGAVVEFLSYEGTFAATDGAAAGLTSTDIGALQNSDPVGTSLHRRPNGTWASEPANFGYCYGVTPPPPANAITFSGRVPSDPALPVGFEDQVFATLRSGVDNSTIPTTFTWTSETPLLASVDANGVVRALGAGTMIIRATAEDGTSAAYALPSAVAVAGSAVYAGNTEFGDPSDGDATDEVIIRRAQYTSSFSVARGIPNWVSYNLEASHFGAEDRCDCFTYDPELPAGGRYTTADYTGAGAAAGYGIDRGHLARSFDRTSGSLDNASTFYFSNIIPQAADNNQGPWAQFENHLGDLARFANREVYVVAGASGSKGTVKGEGRITIPAVTWKAALVLPRDTRLSDVTSLDSVVVVAVVMPNDAGIRSVPWQDYVVTVDAVEAASGFDLFALLRDDLEIALESGTRAPVAAVDGPFGGYDGDPIAMSAAGSTDPDGDALTYAWHFGDGAVATGAAVTHKYQDPGTYTVRVVVTDTRGLADTVTTVTTVTALPPALGLQRTREAVLALVKAGRLHRVVGAALLVKVEIASRALGREKPRVVKALVEAVLHDLRFLVKAKKLTAEEAAPITDTLTRTLRSLGR